MNRNNLRARLPYLLTAAVLAVLTIIFLLSRRPVGSTDSSEPAGRIYVSEAAERAAAEAQARIREARQSAAAASAEAASSPSADPGPVVPSETASVPPASSEAELLLASLREQVRTLDIALFSPEELASWRRRFDNAVFIGDSLTQAFISYGFFDEDHVKYKRSASISQLDEQIQAAIDRLPDTVIFFTGLNDVSFFINDPTQYYEAYLEKVNQVHSALPNAQIFVISLLPCSDALAASDYHLARSPEFDAQLKRLDPSSPARYLDCHWLVRQELYLDDGIHFTESFYTLLIQYLALETGL